MFAFGDKEWPGVAKLAEESGEILQVIGKLMMTHGKAEHWDGSDLRKRFVEECGDLNAALTFVIMKALTVEEFEALGERARNKLHMLIRWHEEQSRP